MDHADAASERLGESAGLPFGGRQAGVSLVEVQKVIEVLQPQPADVAGVSVWKFRVETAIGALRPVVKLAVDAQAGARPDIFDKQAFAPAVVGNHRIRRITRIAQLQRLAEERLATNHFGFEVHHPRVHIGCRAARRAVGLKSDTLPARGHVFLHCGGHHLVAGSDQSRRQKLELAGKILVDKQNAHVESVGRG